MKKLNLNIKESILLKAIPVIALGGLLMLGLGHALTPDYDFQYISSAPYPVIKEGQSAAMTLKIKNTGTATWCSNCANPMRLGTDHPTDRDDQFTDSTWYSSRRINMVESSVAPGQTATFNWNFAAHTGSPKGLTHEYFTPVVEGITWLPDRGLFWDVTVPAPEGVFLFTWYGPGSHRWTDVAPYNPIDTPVGGQYDSLDDSVIRRQLTQIRDAGFDFVVLDWWDHDHYGQEAHIQAAALRVAQILTTEFPTLGIAVMLDSETDNFTVPQSTYDTLWAYAQQSQWRSYLDKPLIVTFGTAVNHDSRYSYIVTGSNFKFWSEPAVAYNHLLSITGTFDDSRYCIQTGRPCYAYDPSLTGSIFTEQTNYAMTQRPNLNLLFVYGWNEYYERTQIEPSTRNDNTCSETATDRLYKMFQNFNKNVWAK